MQVGNSHDFARLVNCLPLKKRVTQPIFLWKNDEDTHEKGRKTVRRCDRPLSHCLQVILEVTLPALIVDSQTSQDSIEDGD
jgi:hypothetical protein